MPVVEKKFPKKKKKRGTCMRKGKKKKKKKKRKIKKKKEKEKKHMRLVCQENNNKNDNGCYFMSLSPFRVKLISYPTGCFRMLSNHCTYSLSGLQETFISLPLKRINSEEEAAKTVSLGKGGSFFL
eukprot:TRINITY_DN25107_c0_g1_i1.p1 TRINITY_DN25107_c0_g1~~TRINITY_DN25107_c0_g1_i1.p1  ORF type:complete len:126 (-),score=2.05 TRINITY_DN25107_c0_g1_i1:171-548(-)